MQRGGTCGNQECAEFSRRVSRPTGWVPMDASTELKACSVLAPLAGHSPPGQQVQQYSGSNPELTQLVNIEAASWARGLGN